MSMDPALECIESVVGDVMTSEKFHQHSIFLPDQVIRASFYEK